MEPPPDGIPAPLWQFAGWATGLIISGMGFLIGWLGKRHINWREKRIKAIEDRQDEILDRLRTIEEQMASDHGQVSGGLAGIRDQLDDIQQEMEG